MVITIDGSDKARLGRKVEKLLFLHPERELMHILRDLSNIKDEMTSLLDLPNNQLEKHIDVALANS